MTRFKELMLPDAAADVEKAVEIVRVFIGGGDSLVSLEMAPFEDRPHQWGFVLADIANHVANSISLSGASDREEVFRQIEDGYQQRLAQGMKITGRNLGAKH